MVLASPFPAPRGTQAWIGELSAALARSGHEVHLFCYGSGLGGVPPAGVEIHRAPLLPGVPGDLDSAPSLARPLNDLSLLGNLLRELRNLRPSVIHGHNHEGGIAAGIAGAALGYPVVHQIHGSLAEELVAWVDRDGSLRARTPLGRRVARGAGKALDYFVPRLAGRVLTLDREAVGKAGLSFSKVTVLPPGVSVPTGPLPADAPRLPRGAPWVVYPGNLDPYQSLDLLMEAWPLVRREIPKARLALVTHDRGGHEMASLPGVEIVRPASAEEARAFIESARFVVIPRTGGGGYPLKMLNALGLCVPVVACRPAAKGLSEADGVLPVEASPLALAGGMARLLRDETFRRSLSKNAHHFAEENPWEKVAEAAARVYDEIAGRESASLDG